MRFLCPDRSAIPAGGLELPASCLRVVSACSLPGHRTVSEDRGFLTADRLPSLRCHAFKPISTARDNRTGTAMDVPSHHTPSLCSASRCSTSRPSSFARIIIRSGLFFQKLSRVIQPSPLTSFPPLRPLSAAPFPDMTGSNMPLKSERLCHRPVAGKQPLVVAIAPDLRMSLGPALGHGSVHEPGRRKRGACVRCRQRRPDQLEALPMAGRPR